jgi:hypothetical protein
MAIGFSPKYIQDYQLDNLAKEHFLILAIRADFKPDWNVSFVSETGLIAYTKFSFNSKIFLFCKNVEQLHKSKQARTCQSRN